MNCELNKGLMSNFSRVKLGCPIYRLNLTLYPSNDATLEDGLLGQIFDFFKRNSKSQFCLMFVNFKIMATSSNIFNSMQTKKSISLSHIWPMNYFFKVLKKKKNYWNSYFIGIELSWVSEKKCYVDLLVIQWPDSPTFFV